MSSLEIAEFQQFNSMDIRKMHEQLWTALTEAYNGIWTSLESCLDLCGQEIWWLWDRKFSHCVSITWVCHQLPPQPLPLISQKRKVVEKCKKTWCLFSERWALMLWTLYRFCQLNSYHSLCYTNSYTATLIRPSPPWNTEICRPKHKYTVRQSNKHIRAWMQWIHSSSSAFTVWLKSSLPSSSSMAELETHI